MILHTLLKMLLTSKPLAHGTKNEIYVSLFDRLRQHDHASNLLLERLAIGGS